MSSVNIKFYEAIVSEIAQYQKTTTPPKLIAVSKFQPVEKIAEIYQLGQLDFAENYVQEAKEKSNLLPTNINWHLIGGLQKNKVKYCPNIFSWIHSLSDVNVANLINEKYLAVNKSINCLIQMNLCSEDSKLGLTNHSQLFSLVDSITKLPAIKLRGLMTIPDPNLTQQQTALIYRKLAHLNQELATHCGDAALINQLSMGMSSDYKIALAEGATMIRVGTAIFGNRQ